MSSRISRIVEPHCWIESTDDESRCRSGTLFVGDTALGGYVQLHDGTIEVAALMFDTEEARLEMVEVEGHSGALIDIDAAKRLLARMSRPFLHDVMYSRTLSELREDGYNATQGIGIPLSQPHPDEGYTGQESSVA